MSKIRVGIIGLGGRGSHSHATALGTQNGVDGLKLPKSIKGNAKANQIVRGQYRKPFIVPDISV